MGSGGSSSSEPRDPTFLNPVGGVLANLFGVGTTTSSEGIALAPGGQAPTSFFLRNDETGVLQPFNPPQQQGGEVPSGIAGLGKEAGPTDPSSFSVPEGFTVVPGGSQFTGDFASQVFGPGSFEPIADLLTMENPFAGVAGALGAQGSIESLTSGLLGTLNEGLETGFRTDIDPIREAALRDFQQEIIPGISEQFATQTGSFSSDFLGAQTRAGADLFSELGALQTQLDEAAAGRRTDLTALAPGVLQAPAEIAGGLLNLGAQLNLETPGGRALNLAQILGGLQPTSAIPRGNESESKQTGILA